MLVNHMAYSPHRNSCTTSVASAPEHRAIGAVNIHDATMRNTVCQCNDRGLSLAPTPKIALVAVCVELTGAPNTAAPITVNPAANWKASACGGRIEYNRLPTVRAIRCPPKVMPSVNASAVSAIVHHGAANVAPPPATSTAAAKRPIVF